MRVVPSQSVGRDRLQTTTSCDGQEQFVVSVVGKGTVRPCQIGIVKMNASEPLMMCRKRKVMSKPGGSRYPGISSGGDLLTARAASGMKVASVRFGRAYATWEPVASMLREPSKR